MSEQEHTITVQREAGYGFVVRVCSCGRYFLTDADGAAHVEAEQ